MTARTWSARRPAGSSRRAPRTAAASAAAAAVLLLSGCNANEIGAAAVIDGKRVPIDQVQSSAREVEQAVENADGAAVQRAVIVDLVRSRMIDRVAAAEGVSVGQGEVDQFLAALDQQAGDRKQLEQAFATELRLPPSQLRSWARGALVQQALGAKLVPGDDADQAVQQRRQQAVGARLAEQAKAAQVSVNPRYGAWDPDQLVIAPLPSGGLAEPAVTPESVG